MLRARANCDCLRAAPEKRGRRNTTELAEGAQALCRRVDAAQAMLPTRDWWMPPRRPRRVHEPTAVTRQTCGGVRPLRGDAGKERAQPRRASRATRDKGAS